MNHYDETKSVYDSFRAALNEAMKRDNAVNEDASKPQEEYHNGDEAIPYTMQDELMASSIETCKKQLGADFEGYETPMLYYPKDGDVVLSGQTSGLNNAKFQFRLKDPTGEGCFVWMEPLQLTESNLNQLKVMYGVFKNWKRDLETAEDKKPIGTNNNRPTPTIQHGDDLD